MNGVEQWREAAALRLLAENGHEALVEPLRAYLEARRQMPGALDVLLGAPTTHRLQITDGYATGPDGSVRVTAGLRLLLAALRAAPEPVEHAYTRGSAERVLRAARADLAKVDARLADAVLPPTIGERTVRAVLRRPLRVLVEEQAGLH